MRGQTPPGDTLEWQNYFDRKVEFEIDSGKGCDVFAAYIAGSVANNILLCMHGGGHTALSWALLAALLKPAFCVVAYDFRGHGHTKCVNSEDLSSRQLADDGIRMVHQVRAWVDSERKAQGYRPPSLDDKELSVKKRILMQSRVDGVPVILMGHSLGGAIAIQVAASGQVPNLQGLIVLDVVEGTALEALPDMRVFVSKFPESFGTVDEAVKWSLENVVRNPKSAAISVPAQLKFDQTTGRWFWDGWFRGISEQFLNAQVGSGGKLLVLVGHERLDKPLTIGHMQGKFQLVLIPKSGHVIEEDQPEDVAHIVLNFGARYQLLSSEFAPPSHTLPLVDADASFPSRSALERNEPRPAFP